MVEGDMNEFIKANIPLIKFFMKKYPLKTSTPDYEEYEAELLVALWKAALKFDPSLGFKFSTYAMKGLFFARRRVMDRNRLIFGNKKGSKLRVKQLNLSEVQEPSRNFRVEIGQHWDEDDREGVRREVDKLPRREREVFQGLFAGKSCSDISRENRVSRQWISCVYSNGVGRLRHRMVETE